MFLPFRAGHPFKIPDTGRSCFGLVNTGLQRFGSHFVDLRFPELIRHIHLGEIDEFELLQRYLGFCRCSDHQQGYQYSFAHVG